ncbi:MAG: MBL fold metallo-hydrolase, partial [Euryarchaeota archaeon]|nr:MBL fold metallo-hydrolase [Euryarchaeota archaeon]
MRIHHIPVPSPFPIGPTNAYLLEGDPLTLIDTGVQSKAALRGLERGLEALGHPLRKVERVIVTHGHQDHFGLAREVRERSGAEVWVHAWDTEWLETYEDSYNGWVDKGVAMARKGGMPGAAAIGLLKMWTPLRRTASAVDVARSLDDGDRFRVDDEEFHVLHTPGHCPGEIVVHAPG